MPSVGVVVDAVIVAEHINAFNRQPFRDILSRALGAEPTPTALRKYANKYPDRYAQIIAIYARLAGFHDKQEVDINLHLDIKSLSDSQLEQRILLIERQLAAKTIEVDVTPSPDVPAIKP